jgi:hypothetical protein
MSDFQYGSSLQVNATLCLRHTVLDKHRVATVIIEARGATS